MLLFSGRSWKEEASLCQGRSQKFVLGGIKVLGWIKLLNSRSDVILPHKKFTWPDFFFLGGDISRFPPVATPLVFVDGRPYTVL